MPPFAASKTTPAEATQFAEDVAYYLTLSPRQLPSRYFYDALGSALFEAICQLPWYRITRAEQRLLFNHRHAILSRVAPSAIVELGPGSGAKLATIVDAVPSWRRVSVHLVDISAAALDQASQALRARSAVTVTTHQASYESGLASAAAALPAGARTLTLFLGSNIGNFDPPGADAMLRAIRGSLGRGDALLVGADLVKPEGELLQAYDDPLGVTAAFNRNLLVRINHELGGDFDLSAFTHRAVWNAEASRVEMHLVSGRAQRVRVTKAQVELTLAAGETIWTESSYKYEPEAIVAALARARFRCVDQWIDAEDRFALTLVEAD
jgi:L-histidine N-alpha-methyltransferase